MPQWYVYAFKWSLIILIYFDLFNIIIKETIKWAIAQTLKVDRQEIIWICRP